MSDTVQLAILAAVVAAVSGFPAWWASVKAARLAAIEADKRTLEAAAAVETAKKVDAVIVQGEKIHELANSNLSKATNALEVANTKLAGLQAVITGMIEEKRREDASKATAAIVAKIPTPPE